MATISSHVLDSVIGTHAGGIRVQCYLKATEGSSQLLFDVVASNEGRISQQVEPADIAPDAEYELVFHSADYYKTMQLPDDGYQILNKVVVRIALPDPDSAYHMPIMLSPHSYSVWWSGNPDKSSS